jgi:predicted HAD superfamily Cof-like phosphohydrolase
VRDFCKLLSIFQKGPTDAVNLRLPYVVIELLLKYLPQTNFSDILELHRKFDLGEPKELAFLEPSQLEFRINFLQEELDEFSAACLATDDYPTAIDSLVDLVVVAIGTAIMMGITPELWQKLWDDVHRANMSKVRGQTARGVGNDLVKPEGWIPPQTSAILLSSFPKHP